MQKTEKKKRNRKKIKTELIKLMIEPKYKKAINEFCEQNNITMAKFVREAIIRNLEFYEWID